MHNRAPSFFRVCSSSNRCSYEIGVRLTPVGKAEPPSEFRLSCGGRGGGGYIKTSTSMYQGTAFLPATASIDHDRSPRRPSKYVSGYFTLGLSRGSVETGAKLPGVTSNLICNLKYSYAQSSTVIFAFAAARIGAVTKEAFGSQQ